MSLYKKFFTESLTSRRRILEGADDALEDAVSDSVNPDETIDASDISADEAALDAELADDAKSTEDVASNPDEEAKNSFAQMKDQIEQSIEQSNAMLNDWADKVHDFLNFVNDPSNENSIKYALDNSVPGSPIEAIKSQIGGSIKRIASTLASLEQQIRSEIGGISVNDVMKNNQ